MDPTISDMYYLQLPTGGPTQADVWTDLPTGNPTSETCVGVIITPRCDFAHEKSPVINYLPIIDFEEYVFSTACFGLLEAQLNDARSSLKGKADAAGLSALAELDLPPWELENSLKSEMNNTESFISNHRSKAAKDFLAGIEQINTLEELNAKDRLTPQEMKQQIGTRTFSKLQRDIIKNNSADTYFLPPCDGILPRSSVVLLRRIYTCPITTVGGSHPRARHDGPSDAAITPQRLLRIRSPFAESLMAKFAALFARVGTRDLPEQSLATFMIAEQQVIK
jgi:hypothetical protein